MPGEEIPINLSFSFQIETQSCFPTVNQIYTSRKLLLNFDVTEVGGGVGQLGRECKGRKKGKKTQKKGK